MKKIAISNFTLFLLLITLSSFPVSIFAQNKKPNVIYIYVDDLGYGELGCYGQQKIKTPYLDKLAKEGMRFTQHYTSSPVCAPARAMLMSGKHAGHSFIRGNYELGQFEDDKEGGQMPLLEGTFTIAKMMKQAGYVTGMVGKWGLGMHTTSGDPNKQGFDYYYGYLCQKQAHNHYPTHLWENGKWDTLRNPFIYVHRPIAPGSDDTAFDYYKGKDYAVTKMTEKAVSFIKANRDNPFFLYLPLTSPHVSLQAPDEAVNEYIGQFDELPYYGNKGYAPCKYPLSTYAAMVTYMDKQVGEIMQLLKTLNIDDNTIVMFSSDNGTTYDVGGVNAAYFNLTSGLRGRKQDLYEGGIKVPFIARWPGRITAGTVSNHLSAQYDLMATLSELTGAKAMPNDGGSFAPTLLNKPGKQKQHDFLYFEFPEKSGQVAIRLGKWKGVKSNMKKNKNAPWEIFNLEKDEKETTDLATKYPNLIIQFEQILQQQHFPSEVKEWEFILKR